jgi:hypothetical protein
VKTIVFAANPALATIPAGSRSLSSAIRVAMFVCTSPAIVPGGKPVIEFVGLDPTFPVTTVEPVLVTADAPNRPKVPAE